MGLTKAKEIFYKGKQAGVDKDLPVAIISNASKENQKIITSTFEHF